MNIFKTILLAGVVSLPFAVGAQAADDNAYVPPESSTLTGFYLRGDLGASYLGWAAPANTTAWAGGGGIGYQASDMLRMDVTADWSGNYNIAPGSTLSTTAVMGNVYFDWKNDSPITPYVGVGVGYGWANYTGGPANDSGIAVGLNAGATMDMTNNLALDVGYHYRDILASGVDPVEHRLTAGFRVKF